MITHTALLAVTAVNISAFMNAGDAFMCTVCPVGMCVLFFTSYAVFAYERIDTGIHCITLCVKHEARFYLMLFLDREYESLNPLCQ